MDPGGVLALLHCPGDNAMRNLLRLILALLTLTLSATLAPAHYHILLPDKHSVKKDESVTLLYRWGHPFEHQLFAAPPPQSLLVIAPDGKVANLTKQLEKIKQATPDNKEVVAYRLKFTPNQRGDYTFCLVAAPVFLKEDNVIVMDVAKAVLHVQAQKNWDADAVQGGIGKLWMGLWMRPLTRPYGLQPGTVFQTQLLSSTVSGFDTGEKSKGPTPLAGALVEVERFNPAPPKQLPADEHITRTLKTDPNGVATCTLQSPGWWAITGQIDGGVSKHNGKDYPVRYRTTFWVHVDEKIAGN